MDSGLFMGASGMSVLVLSWYDAFTLSFCLKYSLAMMILKNLVYFLFAQDNYPIIILIFL